MALLAPMLFWRVRWDGINYVDITDRLVTVNVRHGAGTGNPDRPTILSGTGRAVMRGLLSDEQRQGRFHMHLFLRDPTDPSVEYDIWGGFIAAPRQLAGVEPRHVWKIEGHHSEALQQPVNRTIPTRTLAGLFGDDDFWSGTTGQTPIIVGGIPDRATRETTFGGRVGGFWSSMAAIGSYEVSEDHDGDIHFTNHAPALVNIPDSTLSLDSRQTVVYRDVVTRDRADRIRNILVQDGKQLYRNTDSAIAWGARTLEVPGWWASVSLVSEARAVIDSLAQLRREHTVRIPLAQRTAGQIRFVEQLDTGDYLHVRLQDRTFNIDINETCIIMERTVDWSQQAPTVITLRLLETGLTPPQPTEITFYRLLEDGSRRLLEDDSIRLTEDGESVAVVTFRRLLEDGQVRILETGDSRLLEEAVSG